jgi:uncharacterized lipoprotein YmbA
VIGQQMAVRKGFALVLVLVLVLAGCGSSPRSNYYLLSPLAAHAPAGQSPALGVGPVEIPEYLDRNGLVYLSGANRLQVAGSERWAEPLEDGVRRVVGLNLASLLDTENLSYFPWPAAHAPDYAVRVNVLALEADDRQATLIAKWLLHRPATGEPVARRMSRLQRPLPDGRWRAEQVAPAYSALLFQLSRLIAAAIDADRATAGSDTTPVLIREDGGRSSHE